MIILSKLLAKLEDLHLILRERECFAGLDMWSVNSGAVRTACDIQVDGRTGRPKLT